MNLEKLHFSVKDTIQEVINLFYVGAKQKGLSIKLIYDKQIPDTVIGDSVRLRQVLSNLVGNGVKFTTQGNIVINAGVQEWYENKIKLKFVVTDTGIGIAKDKTDKLFKRFSQVDDSNTKVFGGTGLGLAISKMLVEMMDGDIGVESEEGIGSSFFFTAVFELEEVIVKLNENGIEYNDPTLYKNQKHKKVLLVEDDFVSRNMATIVLKRNGFEVIAVENGKEAIFAAENEQFDLILMDINMPLMDGFTAASVIKKKEKTHTPIIAMTAYALKEDRQKCIDAGMDDYISKPIDINEMISKIDLWIN